MKIQTWKCALRVPFNSFAVIIPEGTGLRGFHCKWSLKSGVVILPCSIATDEYVFSHQHSAHEFSTVDKKKKKKKLPLILFGLKSREIYACERQ